MRAKYNVQASGISIIAIVGVAEISILSFDA